MKTYQRFHRIFYIWVCRVLTFCGHDIFREGGLKRTPYTYFLYGMLALLLTALVYTVLVYDWFHILNAIPIFGVWAEVNSILLNTISC